MFSNGTRRSYALPHGGEGRFVGTYWLSTGSGPEPPVYVAGV